MYDSYIVTIRIVKKGAHYNQIVWIDFGNEREFREWQELLPDAEEVLIQEKGVSLKYAKKCAQGSTPLAFLFAHTRCIAADDTSKVSSDRARKAILRTSNCILKQFGNLEEV